MVGMVLEVLENISAAVRGLIGTWIIITVLNGITINERDAIMTRS